MQINLLLTANNLIGYVNGTLLCPLATTGIGDADIENPTFLHWKRQDNYVFLALMGSCGPKTQIMMSFATSSANAMSRLTEALPIVLTHR